MVDNDNKPIQFNCSENTYTPKALTEADVKKLQKTPVLGGTLIAIGGIYLYNKPFMKCDDCTTDKQWDDFEDDVLRQHSIGYGLIILGGFFVAMGI